MALSTGRRLGRVAKAEFIVTGARHVGKRVVAETLDARGRTHTERQRAVATAAAVGRVAHGRVVGPRAERAQVQQVATRKVKAK